jgi:hypothetical protein
MCLPMTILSAHRCCRAGVHVTSPGPAQPGKRAKARRRRLPAPAEPHWQKGTKARHARQHPAMQYIGELSSHARPERAQSGRAGRA